MPKTIDHTGRLCWYNADLEHRLRLSRDYLCGMLDKDKHDEPFFGILRRADGTAYAYHALSIGIPHVTGRALDALFYIEEVLQEAVPEHAEKVYTSYLLACCSHGDGLPSFLDPEQGNERFVEFHNLREGLEGLTWLVKRRQDETAKKLAAGFIDTVYALTDPKTGALSFEYAKNLDREKTYQSIRHPYPLVQGRLVGAILKYYRLTGNLKALALCDMHARSTLRDCFTPEGLLKDQAGNHIHSITSSLSGILDYAVQIHDSFLIEQVRRIYEIGLAEFYSSYGWCKEQAWLETDQGEVNQVGDLIQVQLKLAAFLDRRYYETAEKFMRSSLLPSQVLENDFIVEKDHPDGDFEANLKDRVIGGFGFPTPSSHLQKEDSAVNTIDITEGAVQGICELTSHIITGSEQEIRINLLFSWENDLAAVISALPGEGRVIVRPKAPKNIFVRIPGHIEPKSLNITCEGKSVDFVMFDGYAAIENTRSDVSFEVTFHPESFTETECVYHKPYQVSRFGEQVVRIDPVDGIYPLFGSFP